MGNPVAPRVAWFVVFACALAVLPIELGRQAPLYWRVFTWTVYLTMAIATLALVDLRGGRAWSTNAMFPLIFVATAVPWPTMIEQPVTVGLAHSVAAFVGDLLQVSGTPARIEGTVIVLPRCTVGIAEACSGVRSLQSALMISLAVGELLSLENWRRWVLVPIGFVIALATNTGRTLALSIVGAREGESGMNAVHDTFGWFALAGLVLGILAMGFLIRGARILPANADDSFDTGSGQRRLVPNSRRWLAVVGMVVAGAIGAEAWYAAHDGASGVVSKALVEIAPTVELRPLFDEVREAVHPTAGSYARLSRPDAPPATGYHLYWDDSQNNYEALFHRPDVCMPGVGWESAGEVSTALGRIGEMPVQWAVLPYQRNGVKALLLWAAWLDREQVRFSLHTGSSVQRNTLMRLIRNGRRRFSYEVAAVMIPYDGAKPPTAEAVDAASRMFGVARGDGL